MRLATLLAAVAPPWARLRLDTLTIADDQIVVDLSSTARIARCPDCQRRSHRAHSHFMRVLADLPLGKLPVRVRLHARRFRCLHPTCSRQTFRERLPDLALRYQRCTPALRRYLEAVSFAVGGQAGRRLARQMQRLVASAALPKNTQGRLVALFQALDPVRLLHQLHALQDALWQHAIIPTGVMAEAVSPTPAELREIRFDVQGCGLPSSVSCDTSDAEDIATSSRAELTELLSGHGLSKRKYRRRAPPTARMWRTRADPFALIWGLVRQRLERAPERTAKAIFLELQQEYPGCYPDGQLRTLQQRVKEWRAHAILQFDQRGSRRNCSPPTFSRQRYRLRVLKVSCTAHPTGKIFCEAASARRCGFPVRQCARYWL